MADNLSIKITADVVDLQAKFAVARSESSALTAELNKLARQAATSGMTDELKGQLNQAAEAMLSAKAKTTELSDALTKELHPASLSASSALTVAKEAAGAFGLALSVGGVISFGRSLLESTAALGSEARALSISTDALQAYRAAAVQNGGTTDEADAAIRRFTRSLGDAAATLGPARKAFEDLGLSAADLAGGTQASLPTVANALLSIRDASERARNEIALFGKSGQDVERFLRAWADPAIVAAMERDGQVLDHELIERAEKFTAAWATTWQRWKNDAVLAIGGVIDGFKSAGLQGLGAGLASAFANEHGSDSVGVPFKGVGPGGAGAAGWDMSAENAKAEQAEREHQAVILEIRRQNDGLLIQQLEKDQKYFKALADGQVDIEASKYKAIHQFDLDRAKSAQTIGAHINELNKVWLEKEGVDIERALHREVALEDEAAREKARIWHGMLQPFNAALDQMLAGHASFANIAAGLSRGLTMALIRDVEEYVVASVAGERTKQGVTRSSALGDAYAAAVGSFKALAGIPYVGPVLGAAAFAGTLALTLAGVDAIPSFDKGSNYIPHDMLAMVHRGEAIVPAGDNTSGFNMSRMSGGHAGATNNFQYSPTIHGVPKRDIIAELEAHSADFISMLRNHVRTGALKFA